MPPFTIDLMSTNRNTILFWLIAVLFGTLAPSTICPSLSAQSAEGAAVTTSLTQFPVTRFWLSPSVGLPVDGWESPASELIKAIVVDIDERDIVCVSKENPTTPFKHPASQLQAIEVIWANETAVLAHSAFARGEFAAAIENSKKAIAEGKIPRWQQKILASEITDSLANLGQTTNACRVFVSLCKESPAALLYASAPLNWTSQRGNTQLVQQAQEWIQADRAPIEQLIGASWLLNGNEVSSARSMMEQLRRSKSTVIAQLATVQLWRLELPNQVAQQYPKWSEYRDRMLLPLQIGPTMTIADKLERAGRKEEALQEWLRIVAIHPKQRREVPLARESAVELLTQLGRIEEANRLRDRLR